MALVMRKFKRFYKKDFNTRGKNPSFKKGGQSSSLFKASRLFQSYRKEKGALEAKLEALKKKKKVKGLIGVWDQDSSESEGEEKANLCFIAIENEVQSSPSNLSNFIDDDDDDDDDYLNSLLIEMYHELEKITKKNKELKNKIDNLSNENSKLVFFSLEKCMVDYDDLKKKVSDLTLCIEKFTNGKENFENAFLNGDIEEEICEILGLSLNVVDVAL
ncbi:hypothetical protein M9H77_34345 [Catharanthus roseus]|uniref:Uncharacterized protein n=1 Tax=Catharanthus roseus TaxID=4058 RepID=A0ACB9ZPJ2_CATRO|nr:hypothetical protein M9H77_34345 [Catharanthus roseus]